MSMMEGSLSKWTNVMKGWQYRWFVLDDNAGLLSYYTSKEKMMRGVRRGCVRLRAAVIGIDDEDDSTFTITVDHKTFHFQARDGDERERWVRALEDTIARHGRRDRWPRPPQPATPRPHQLERRVAEADAYLMIMIEQIAKLEMRISEIVEPADKAKAQTVLDHANAMLENIKHSIVLLQIAKNTVNPVNGIYNGPVPPSPNPSMEKPGGGGGVEAGAECTERTFALLPGTPPLPRQPMTLLVPETSYSSSEGEEDYYDADDEPYSSPTPSTTHRDSVSGVGVVADSGTDAKLPTTTTLPRTEDGAIDYDALYDEDDSDNDLGSMESHGSVITHLLSQVKIGMDLTKVVLPTFILERRSLLEMYADYFAHPDQFVRIADMTTPRDRMVQVVRWYLSSYHSGRKSAVAKKPYNPILGEVFRCHWDLDESHMNNHHTHNDTGHGADNKEMSDGPVPWCTSDQLTFVAEQVSHHPPISAFYAEHYNKKIQFEAWVWTKSKFLGLSIGVHNIGKGVVSLLDLQEDYTLSFPNGYGRSILTVPWIELGGPVTIECAQTGHKATIEFLTKPFYGGKRNRVTCEVFGRSEKKPYLTAAGEWNSRMEATWTETGRTEVLFDASCMRASRKLVRSVAAQASNESRRVWRHVTAGLRAADVDAATAAKRHVEQAQRDQAKRRGDAAEKWITQLFSPTDDEGWRYKEPLKQRIALDNKHNTPSSKMNPEQSNTLNAR